MILERLPVLLFIHGDGYDMSTGAAFDGAIFASYTKTIVVTINYRLGPFGKKRKEESLDHHLICIAIVVVDLIKDPLFPVYFV
jgi:carboxylesterase type B